MSGSEKRSFYRVTTRIPIRLRALDEAEATRLAAEIVTPGEEPPVLSDPALAATLQRLERKLDLVLALVDTRRERPLAERDTREVSLSAAGVALEWEAAGDLGEHVLVELQLPGAPAREVRTLAHPVSEAGGKDARVALSFDVIAEADREAIVRFSHDVQRVALRERARESRPE